jgi:phosphatidylinositol alpha-1,6-mannosyltransferase
MITRNFPPLWGGMERLNLHLVEELSRRFVMHVVAPDGASKYVTSQISVTQAPLRPLALFLSVATIRAVCRALTWRPHIVIAGSGLTAPIAFLAAKLYRARSFAYVHGLDLAVSNPIYRAFWYPSLRRLNGVIANSQSTAQLALDIGIASERISIVHPGVTIPNDIDRSALARFREKHRLSSGPILLSVGRLTTRKGIREFVAEVLPLIVAQQSDAQLVVVGDVPTDSLHAKGQSIESILQVARTIGVEKNIHFLGKQFGEGLADAYYAAAVHIFPVRSLPSDPEGFGMVAIEAAAHGLATVAYATGGVVDAVCHGQSGCLVAPGKSSEFAAAVLQMITSPLPKEKICEFAGRFSRQLFGEHIAAVIESDWVKHRANN